MATIHRLLVAFLSLSTSFAIPLDSSAADADAHRTDTVVEINTRFLLSQLAEHDQPKMARNSMSWGELPTITLPYVGSVQRSTLRILMHVLLRHFGFQDTS